MKITKEQANNLLTEIKEVLAKNKNYNNYVLVQTKDGLHLSTTQKSNIVWTQG